MGNSNTKYKFYFMRHGETIYNSIKDKSVKYNPNYADCHLSQKGISQSISKQKFFNKFDIEVIYVSPYYRAIETMQYCFQNHPNAKNIIAYVHPKLAELSGMIQEFILDIKQTKKSFNMDSKIKVNWNIFDEYLKEIKYKEHLFFMDNWDLIEEKKRDEIYNKLDALYEKGDMDLYKKEVSKIIEERFKTKLKFESYKHAYQRFIDFKNYIYNNHKNSMIKLESKIIAISHKLFISIATSKPESILSDKSHVSLNCLLLNNCEMAPFLL